MIATHTKTTVPRAVLATLLALLALTATAAASTPPVKLIPNHTITNGFEYAEGVAVGSGGNIYVTDRGHRRVQELEANGTFVRMFGKEVNETAHLNHETANENICPVKPGDKCKAGVEGTGSGEFGSPKSIAVDAVTGNVYVVDVSHWRVEEFTATGVFLRMFGKEVNETAHLNHETANENICPVKTGDKCKSGIQAPIGGTEPGAFNFKQFAGNLLAVGPNPAEPAEEWLYVGDEHRVQEFNQGGTQVGEIPLTAVSSEPNSQVLALAVDEAGNVYLGDATSPGTVTSTNIVREFDPTGKEIKQFTVAAAHAGAELGIDGLALEGSGRLAVSVYERGYGWHGVLLESGTGEEITEFSIPGGSAGISFNNAGELYATTQVSVVAYTPVSVAELVARPVGCSPGGVVETSVTLSCSLEGEVNPFAVPGTEVWFQWGRTCAFGSETPVQSGFTGSALLGVSAPIETGVRPNQKFCYRLVGYDNNVKPPEKALTSKPASGSSFATVSVPPRSVGEPTVAFVRASSAVMESEVNPENAGGEYFFEYASGVTLEGCPRGVRFETCAGVGVTGAEEAPCATVGGETQCVYGKLGVALEATGLQPATRYQYRLNAISQYGEGAVNEDGGSQLEQGVFTTAPAPLPEAHTGAYSALSATGATVAGIVDPDGLPATYAFEVGVDRGAGTQYGVASSGPAGAGSSAIEERLPLTGLQPGTTYAYRIAVSSGYIDNASHTVYGAPVTFTTAGLPAVLALSPILAQLPVPPVAFPKPTGSVKPKTLTRAQRLARALKACARKPRSKRAACRRGARKRYGTVGNARTGVRHRKGAHRKRS